MSIIIINFVIANDIYNNAFTFNAIWGYWCLIRKRCDVRVTFMFILALGQII